MKEFKGTKGKWKLDPYNATLVCSTNSDNGQIAECRVPDVGGYYGRSNSLILSARVKGSITETIEYNLSVKEVAQCQGLQNSKSEHHDKILQVFNSKVVNQILKRIS